MNDWFYIKNIEEIDSPALVIYPERIKQNIQLTLQIAGSANKLRPHVKTNKMAEVCRLMIDAGITKFKCATIAEAEMLAQINAPDVLLAYQPVGPKIKRFINLIKTYPATTFSCLIDNEETALELSLLCKENQLILPVYMDVNIGMNRTGIHQQKVMPLLQKIKDLKGIIITGFHGYDGHIHDSDITIRQKKSDEAFQPIESLWQQASQLFNHPLKIIMGGTPTFPTHLYRAHTELSPGTFIFWDWGYNNLLPDQPFKFAALVITRVVSIIDETTICTDLGHKSVAAENPLPRVHFLNAQNAVPISQSEEHLVLKVPQNNSYKIGDVLYGVPVHICPTVALYEKAFVIENNCMINEWKIIARDRFITI